MTTQAKILNEGPELGQASKFGREEGRLSKLTKVLSLQFVFQSAFMRQLVSGDRGQRINAQSYSC